MRCVYLIYSYRYTYLFTTSTDLNDGLCICTHSADICFWVQSNYIDKHLLNVCFTMCTECRVPSAEHRAPNKNKNRTLGESVLQSICEWDVRRMYSNWICILDSFFVMMHPFSSCVNCGVYVCTVQRDIFLILSYLKYVCEAQHSSRTTPNNS